MKRFATGFALIVALVAAAAGLDSLRAAIAPEAAAQHWAFQPLQRATPPGDSSASPIDGFLGTARAPAAAPRTLLRRMTYDLTGLPPTVEEMDSFVAEYQSHPAGQRELVARTIDRLLASPAYGEKWGRKWLDLARYADTAGENTDRPLHHAWRYRNYVIGAFNKDLPYDEFIREQIAGDLLAAREPERYAELTTATGYLAIARRFGHDIEKDMHLTFEDVIDTIGKSVLGLTLGCARCHDHKYDPVSTADYYGIYGILESTKFAFPGCEPSQKPRDMMPLWNAAEMALKRKPFEDELAAVEERIKKLRDLEKAARESLAKVATNNVRLLAQGEFEDGGAASFSSPEIVVKPGEMVRLTVLPRANYGADTTLLEFRVEELAGEKRKWDLTADVVDDFLAGNPHADRMGNPAAWCFLDGRKGFELLNETVRDHQGKKGLNIWRSGENPAAFVNASGDPIKVWTPLPARSLFVHPAADGPVAVAWVSPVGGAVRVHGRVADAHAGGGDGVGWKVEHFGVDLGAGLGALAKVSAELREPLRQKAGLMAREPRVPVAYAVTDGKPGDTHLQKRGDPEQPGEIVPRKNLALLGGQKVGGTNQSGRLDLAQWLTDPKNPLTARVMANRIWQGHFGEGIVATPSDFGARGAKPTQPELLDWLARQFIESGWSMKAMHRLIMSSAAYQQAGQVIPASPGRGFARRRLEAEEIRDTLLALSGELDPTPGAGHPFPKEDANFTQHTPFKAVYDSKKRSVYLMTQRIQKHPFLALFDGPDANASSPARGRSTVPTQSLYFLNDPFFHAQSEAFARRLLREPEGMRVRLAHRLAFQREASDYELHEAREFLAQYRAALDDWPELANGDRDLLAWSAYARTLLASNELLYVD